MEPIASEILLNAYTVGHPEKGERYEFVLNEQLQVRDCVKIQSLIEGVVHVIRNRDSLEGVLFELNHVRVNPSLDNSRVIEALTLALQEIGVTVTQRPLQNTMALCYKPLGEIHDRVRFYVNQENKLVLLSPTMRPKLIYQNKP
jgi:hypothetical protein